MIVRILNEGQYELRGDKLISLDELDRQLTEAIASNNESLFKQTFNEMLNTVRNGGKPLADSILAESDLVLPVPETTLSEVQELFYQ